MSKKFELIVFDWDGTLMDSQQRILDCLKAAASDCSAVMHTDEAFCNIIGLGLAEAVKALYPNFNDDQITKYADRYRHHYLVENQTHSPLFDGVNETLSDLKSFGYRLAVATSKGRQGLDKVLNNTDLTDFFMSTRCASETKSKPHPLMLHEIMHELGAKPEQTLMIGDTEYDMQLAQNAGTHFLAVSYGVHSLERLLKYQPLGYIDSITDLPGWLQQHQ